MKTLTSAIAVAALTAAGLVATAPAGHTAPERAAKATRTPFALSAFGVGTVVRGGDLPAQSGRTAYRIIGCTNNAGVERRNHVAEAEVPGLGTVSGVSTRIFTDKKGDRVGSTSIHSIGQIVIGEGSGAGTLTLNALKSVARAYHDDKGFHAEYESDVGRIVYQPVEGGPEIFVAPNPGETLEIPGLARITLGGHTQFASGVKAISFTTALRIEVIPSGTTARVAAASAKIFSGVRSGLFNGSANATRATALNGIVTSGPQPHLPMPCEGTKGELRKDALAGVDLGGQVQTGAANVRLRSNQNGKRAFGFTESSLAEVSIGGGQLVITGIVGRANVEREGRDLKANAKGTTIGSIVANGEPQEFPDPGQALEIPGVAKIETRVITRTKYGIKVTSVRITLLDGTGAVLDLGQAELGIKPSGL